MEKNISKQANLISRIKSVNSFAALNKFIVNSSPKTINLIIRQNTLRKLFIDILDKYLKKIFLVDDKEASAQLRADRYHMFRAVLHSVNKVLDNASNKSVFLESLTKRVLPNLVQEILNVKENKEAFRLKNGIYPPAFLTISPGKFCNLKCTGCYANSSSGSSEKLSYDTVDRIITEKTKDWGSWFTVVSGGEPFAWRSDGKGILDLAKKHKNNLFLVYTNSTLITKEVALKLAELGNITPAISVEGFEKETDERRGKGVHNKILQAMENLKEVGVPFGISVTATRKNAELITSDKFMDYWFAKGASYCWMFQLMPIGRADLNMMVTPEQRLEMFRKTKHLIKDKKYFIADFWNCGAVVNGCLSAGKYGGSGYLYIEWNGNITPCVFNPFAAANINEVYQNNMSLNDVVMSSYFSRIREWQKKYGYENKKGRGNWILPCPMKDHYADIKKIVVEEGATAIDEFAAESIRDKGYERAMKKLDDDQEKVINPIWEEEYNFGKEEE